MTRFDDGRPPTRSRTRSRVARPAIVVATVMTILVAGGGVGPLARGDDERAGAASFGTRIPVPGLPGALVLAGPGVVPAAATDAFIEHAGGDRARVVVLTTAGEAKLDRVVGDTLRARRPDTTRVITIDGEAAPHNTLEGATGVWLVGDDGASLARGLDDDAWRRALRVFHARGGVIGISGGAAAVTERLALLPGVVVVDESRRLDTVTPGVFGLALPSGAALVVEGRRGRVVGRRPIGIVLAANARRPVRVEQIPPGGVVDVIALSRAAVARAIPDPPSSSTRQGAGKGTLFIGGGGRLPPSVVRDFIEASGGPNASIVVVPAALGAGPGGGGRDVRMLRSAGARNVSIIDARTPAEAETPATLTALREAGGIWFSGGRQWRLVDAFLDTTAQTLMHEVLQRGGAIGGSSAGASIQAEYMVRGHPLGNRVMMAEGYERGLGFLPGVAVDQHFSQRGRRSDMVALKRAYPELLGIGIDEGTVAVVHGCTLEVVGSHRVHIYAGVAGDPRATILEAGDRYDVGTRERVDTRMPGRGG